MKYLRKIFAALIIVSACSWIRPHTTSAQVTVSFQLFYDQLSPYGQWVNYPNTGYVWIPNAGPGFSPYATAGHWVYTDFGWTWVSDYPWGWAPFHYGRWNYEPVYGWIWVPDNVWGPAWVSWRRSPGYYGWVPLGHGRNYDNDNARWVFVSDRDIDRNDIDRHYVNKTTNITIIKNSTVITNSHQDKSRNVTYVAGPDRDDVQKSTGRALKPVAIQDNDKPGQQVSNGQLKIYRPQVQKENANGQKPAPAKVADLKDVKPEAERSGSQQTPATKQKPQNDQQANPSEQDNKQQHQDGEPKNNQAQPQASPQNQGEPDKQSPAVNPGNDNEVKQAPPPQNKRAAAREKKKAEKQNNKPPEPKNHQE